MPYQVKRTFTLLTWLFLTLVLAACGDVAESTVPNAATVAPIASVAPTTTIATPPQVTTLPPDKCNYKTLTVAAGGMGVPLPEQIKQSSGIFQASVTKIGLPIWNTPDGKYPTECTAPPFFQYAPVELTVTEPLRGDLQPGQKVTVYLQGAPGSLPNFSPVEFPQLTEKGIWFIGENRDLRNHLGKEPLLTANVGFHFVLQPNGTYRPVLGGDTLSVAELKEQIKQIPFVSPTPSNGKPPASVTAIPPATVLADDKCGYRNRGLAAAIPAIPLAQQLRDSSRVFQARVTKIGPSVWNTPNSQYPTDCGPLYQQVAPVELTIIEGYKGEVKAGEKITIYLSGGPDNFAKNTPNTFPRLNEQAVWLLGVNRNLREDVGGEPFYTPSSRLQYILQPDGQWKNIITQTLTIAELKETIKNPPPTPTPVIPPTPTKLAGQQDFGVTTYTHGKVTNPEAMQGFLAAYTKGQPALWNYIIYTIEGDPIIYSFRYEGNGLQFRLAVDTTQDDFGEKTVRQYTCQKLQKEAKAINFIGCSDGQKTSDWGLATS